MKKTGHRLTAADTVISENFQVCSNCRKAVPPASFALHQVQCQRNNWRCEFCGSVMHKSAKDKHLSLKHSPVTCRCGTSLEPETLQVHKKHECQLRLVRCIYCPLRIPLVERGPHQGDCGNRQSYCRICSEPLKRKEVKRHLVRQHDMVENSISYNDFL
eukprot:TRINITY_DN5504_c0_g1_i3.p1 TRINITY_DN5504_c0_g1~~TRINITY_DN5504_c0_g1_i3.p1  ORF type:complete len:159 (-),score=13.80 TRINITY_DN5504_c0_g1_i3:194-670(-)